MLMQTYQKKFRKGLDSIKAQVLITFCPTRLILAYLVLEVKKCPKLSEF